MKTSIKWLIVIVTGLFVLLILLAVLAIVFDFNIMSFLSQGAFSMEDFSQPVSTLMSEVDYEGFDELTHEGMILERNVGEDIVKTLEERVTMTECTGCNPCTENPDPNVEAYYCSDCDTCSGITAPGRFTNCFGCDPPAGNCSFCDDTGDDYTLCKDIEACIVDYAGDKTYKEKTGCLLREISHKDDTPFNIDLLKSVIDSCAEKSIDMNVGNNMMRELCYFNSTSISYYESDKSRNFYFKEDLDGGGGIMYDNDLKLTPFYKEGEEMVPHYRIFVSIEGLADSFFDVFLGKFQPGAFPIAYKAKIGTIETDSNGFGYAEFTEIPDKAQTVVIVNDVDWKNKPEENYVNGIQVTSEEGTMNYVYVSFDANDPISNDIWTYDLKYSTCNFKTNVEPYLDEGPWWAIEPYDLKSSWKLIDGNQNSSIKVFYDYHMDGGGRSFLRGNVKLVLGRLDTDFQRNCKFDIYVCSQDAFAEYEGENVLSLTDFFANFNPTAINTIIDENDEEIILYNTFDFSLDKDYTIDEIKSAIKTGFRLWEQNLFVYVSTLTDLYWLNSANNSGIYSWNFWEEKDIAVSYDDDCWNSNVLNYMDSENGKFLIGSCPGGICREKLRVRVAFKYRKIGKTSVFSNFEKNDLNPTITFCSSKGYVQSEYCSNNIREGPEICDTTDDSKCPAQCQANCVCSNFNVNIYPRTIYIEKVNGPPPFPTVATKYTTVSVSGTPVATTVTASGVPIGVSLSLCEDPGVSDPALCSAWHDATAGWVFTVPYNILARIDVSSTASSEAYPITITVADFGGITRRETLNLDVYN